MSRSVINSRYEVFRFFHHFFVIISFCLFFAFSFFSFLVSPCVAEEKNDLLSSPKIVCTNSVFNFGSTTNHVVTHVYFMENAGSTPLEISNVKVCCGASSSLSTNVIMPKERVELEITLTIRPGQGRLNKSVYVHSNDPVTPVFQLRLRGESVRDKE